MADTNTNTKDILSNLSNAANAEQTSQQTTKVSGNEVQVETSTTANAQGATTTTNQPITQPTTTDTNTVEAPTPTVTTKTTTVEPTTTPVDTNKGDQSSTATVATPTSSTASGTTAVTTTTAESGVSPALSDELYTSNPVFNDYASKSGYTVQVIDGNVYVNNSLVDWKKLGMTFSNGKLTGTKAQYDQLLQMVKGNGYTTGETFTEFAVNAGYKVTRSSDGKYVIINGIPVDPTLYDSMTQLNGNWVGKTETYQQMISEAMMPTKADPDYLSSTEFADYARAKGYTVETDVNGYGLIVNGYCAATEKYPGIKLVNGKAVADEATYRQILLDSQIYSKVTMDDYYRTNGYMVSSNADGYMTVSKDGKVWYPIHAPYWTNVQGGLYMANASTTKKGWYGSEEVYDAILREALNRSEYSFEDYCKTIGYTVTRSTKTNNLIVDGKEIPGTADTSMYGATTAKYYNDLILVDGKFVGSEATYRKILTDLQARSNSSFQDYGTQNNATVTVMNDKVYVNGNLVDISGTSLQIVNGTVYGTDADYKALVDKANAGYKYTSPYEAQIQAALQEIQNFEAYQTPQETLDQINQLMDSAKERFNYDPTQDSALKTAQKEAERVVRETSGSRGMLYSSGTVAQAAKKAGELIPTYEQQAYNRWADQKNREANLLQTIMDWDNMQSQRNVDQLNLIKTKFDTIMDMDSKTLEQFKVMLDQRNSDRQYALDMERMNIEQQQAALDLAWKRVEALGYVDQEASLVLGVPVGTKASWAQQAALEHEYALNELAQQNAYQISQQQNQAAIERSLTEYKAALDEATQNRLLAQQYSNEKALAAQNYQNQLYLAKKYGT